MNQDNEYDDSPAPLQEEPDLVVMIKRLQQQMTFLEKKIDMLIERSSERQFRERDHSKPFRSYGHSSRHSDGNRDRGPREGNFEPRRHFDRPRRVGESRGFGHRKSPFSHRRRDRD
jgi:hypothetical protein